MTFNEYKEHFDSEAEYECYDQHKFGTAMGFPTCCIKFFTDAVDMTMPEGLPDWWENYTNDLKLSGTGFIPCPKCNEKSEQDLINDINSRRSPLVNSFPDETLK